MGEEEGDEEGGKEGGAEEADWECQDGEEADKIWNEDGGRVRGGAVLKVSRSGMRRIKMGRMRTSMREGGEVEGGDEGDWGGEEEGGGKSEAPRRPESRWWERGGASGLTIQQLVRGQYYPFRVGKCQTFIIWVKNHETSVMIKPVDSLSLKVRKSQKSQIWFFIGFLQK